jgi:putative RNA 2'-phosphotransferase
VNLKLISKEISFALRHNPQQYGLELDEDGWTDLAQLLKSLRNDQRFSYLTEADIVNMITLSEKKRHEISNGRIRAIYGHSITKKIEYESSNPPCILYHGTANRYVENILRQGLVPKSRQYVHLSEDVNTALSVGKRRDEQPVILKIDAVHASVDGILFYFVDESIWLADSIPAKYLSLN